MTYEELFGKYLEEAEDLTQKGDRVQASEKYWGATVELLKMIGQERDWPHHHHRDLQIIINSLFKETRDAELFSKFDMAQALHANFYEDFLDEDAFRIHSEEVKTLLGKLQKLNGKK